MLPAPVKQGQANGFTWGEGVKVQALESSVLPTDTAPKSRLPGNICLNATTGITGQTLIVYMKNWRLTLGSLL
jgi:hypothetical protein